MKKLLNEKIWPDRLVTRKGGQFWLVVGFHHDKRLPARVLQCFSGSSHPCRIWGYCMN